MSGILGQAAPAATTNTTVYTVPATKVATVIINIVNTSSSLANVRVAISATGTPSASEFIEHDAQILANGGVLERTGVVMQAGKNVVVFSDIIGTSVSVYGFEE
jgi:threonine dehydrogenase-like Zn-dependent dehydrogenase